MTSGFGNSVMRTSIDIILLREACPKDGFWPDGPTAYGGDEAAAAAKAAGELPRQDVVRLEFEAFVGALDAAGIPYAVLPWPDDLDAKRYSDGVFITDSAIISPGRRSFVPTRFHQKHSADRQMEAPSVWETLEILGLKKLGWDMQTPDAYIEGGEVTCGRLANGEPYLLTGAYRNTPTGNSILAKLLGVDPACHLTTPTRSFHRDTVSTDIWVSGNGGAVLGGYLFAPSTMRDRSVVEATHAFFRRVGVPVYELEGIDSGEMDQRGTLAANCMPYVDRTAAYLIGTQIFQTPGAYGFLDRLGVTHVYSPMNQRKRFGSGGAHCSSLNVRTTVGDVINALHAGKIKGTNILKLHTLDGTTCPATGDKYGTIRLETSA